MIIAGINIFGGRVDFYLKINFKTIFLAETSLKKQTG